MTATLQRWGNSQGIRVPKQLLDKIGAKIGSEFAITLSEDRSMITLSPLRDSRPVRGRHRIEDLIAASRHGAFDGKEAWTDSRGREVW